MKGISKLSWINQKLLLLVSAAIAAVAFWMQHDPISPTALESSLATPKLRPGEWIDIRVLSGSDVTLRQRPRVNAQLKKRQESPQRFGGDWSFAGPDNIGGRVVDLVVDPNAADTVYAAAASGGIWRSTDAGDTFDSVWPDSFQQSMGALAMSANGKLYAGTGESNPGGGSLTYGNSGVFTSEDGGISWVSSGLENSDRISQIAIDPNDVNRIYVAATGPLYSPGGQRGVYRSLDGGATWLRVLTGLNSTTGASGIVIDPDNPNRLYAAMWDHLRQPALRRYGGEGSGIYRSDDGGDNWQRLGALEGLPDSSTDIGRVSIALAPSQPSTLYSISLNTRGFFVAAYRSDDGGDNWTQLPFSTALASSQSSFGWWFARIWVDPVDPNHVFVAGVPLIESVNGGQSFIDQTSIHADQHAMAWDPNVPGRVYLGNDGGVYRSEANGSDPWVFASKQPFTQLYTLDVSRQDSSRIVAGSQDNRCLRSYDNDGLPFWNQHGLCGDGLENVIDPNDQNIVYSCSQYGFCGVSFDGGGTTDSLGPTASARRNWQTPLVISPVDSATVFFAGDVVERSDNFGGSWTTVSPVLTDPDPFPSPIDTYPFGTASAMDVAATDDPKMIVGTDSGRLWRLQGTAWEEITKPSLPDRWITRVLINPLNDDEVFISYSGFRNDDDAPYVFKSTDFGTTWSDISSDLPSAPINALALDLNGQLIAGGDAGVFQLLESGSWNNLGANLPLAPVTDLSLSDDGVEIFAATFGRGVWKIDSPAAVDTDSDGIVDALDNCIEVSNAGQVDIDQDGYGNACDADFNQDCIVAFIDFSLLVNNFLSTTEPVFDLNSDGVINFIDVSIYATLFLAPPGPSGLTNDCAID